MNTKSVAGTNPRNILDHVSIKNRLVVLATLTALGFALFGGVYAYFNNKTSTAFYANGNFALTAKSVLDAQISILKLRAIESQFLAQKKPKIAKQFDKSATALLTYISRVKSQIDDGKTRNDLKATHKLLEIYKKDFSKVVSHQKALGFNIDFVANVDNGSTSEANLTVLFSNQATAMEKRLSEEMEFGDASTMLPLVTSFYRSRQMASDYMQSGKKDSIQQFYDETKRLISNLNASDLEEDTKTSFLSHIKSYQASVKSWADEFAALTTSSVQLGELSSIIQNQFTQIVRHSQSGHNQTSIELYMVQELMTYSLLITGLVVLGVVLLLNFLISKSISRPIARMTNAMQRLAQGDTSITIETNQTHEIGSMVAAISIFRDNAIERKRLQQAADLEHEKEHRQAQYIDMVLNNYCKETKRIMAVLVAVTDKVKQTSSTLTSVATNATKEANNAHEASDSASHNVQTVASATEQLSSSIREISRQALDVSQIIEKSSDDIEHIDKSVNDLSAAAQKIGDVVGMIREIAEQTNLLALNATIEAARAGEAGAGFAIVAQEVKALANQTAKATEEITNQIGSVQESALASANDIGGITDTMEEIKSLTATIAAAVEQQDAATREIAHSVSTASDHTNQVTSSVAGVTSSINETAIEASEVMSVVKELNDVQLDLSSAMSSFAKDVVTKAA